MSRIQKRFLDCTDLTVEEAEQWGDDLCHLARDVPWMIGDLARWAEAKLGENHSQVFPAETSPGMIERYKGVARLYPEKADRRLEATFTQYMQCSRKPDRLERLQAIVDAGQTSDESRKTEAEANSRPRCLVAYDTTYFLHRFWHSGAGVEAAMGVAGWIQRTTERLKGKGVTDCVCAFDSPANFRKELTKGNEWKEERYKDRPPRDPELIKQLQMVRTLLEGHGFLCASIEGMEADDILASYAAQFDGKVIIVTADKDLRQTLSDRVVILLDVEWTEDETSGDMLPDYKWLSAKQHTEATGIRPEQWSAFQAVMGDTVDGVRGVIGVGEKGAADLIQEFGTIEAVVEAAKAGNDHIKPKKRQAIIEFESKLDVTRQLVTLRVDLSLPASTRV